MLIDEIKIWILFMFVPFAVYLVGYLLIKYSLRHDEANGKDIDVPPRAKLSPLAFANMAVVLNLSTLPTNLFVKESFATRIYYQLFKIGSPAIARCECLLLNPTHHINNL